MQLPEAFQLPCEPLPVLHPYFVTAVSQGRERWRGRDGVGTSLHPSRPPWLAVVHGSAKARGQEEGRHCSAFGAWQCLESLTLH